MALDLAFELITFFCVSYIMALQAPSPGLPLFLQPSLLLMSHGRVCRDTHAHRQAHTHARTHTHRSLPLKPHPCPSKVPAHPLPHAFIHTHTQIVTPFNAFPQIHTYTHTHTHPDPTGPHNLCPPHVLLRISLDCWLLFHMPLTYKYSQHTHSHPLSNGLLSCLLHVCLASFAGPRTHSH